MAETTADRCACGLYPLARVPDHRHGTSCSPGAPDDDVRPCATGWCRLSEGHGGLHRPATEVETLRAALSASEARAAALEADCETMAASLGIAGYERPQEIIHHVEVLRAVEAAARALARRRGEALRGLVDVCAQVSLVSGPSAGAFSDAYRAARAALSDERESEGGGESR
jgi:hypothetical protein